MSDTANNPCLFIVDDEPIQNEMLKDYLTERFLYNVKAFETGETALAAIDEFQPKVIVLDYHLSGSNRDAMDGIAVLKVIKEKHPEIQVIMLSGQDKIDVAVDTMKYGAFDYVVKGESGFARVENIINNIGELYKLKSINESQKKSITFLVIVISLIIIASIYISVIKPYMR